MACKRYRCDACMAVSHQISQKFAKNTKKKMKSWDVMEVLDDTCKEAAFPGFQQHQGKDLPSQRITK